MKQSRLGSISSRLRGLTRNRSIILKYFIALLVLEFLIFTVLGVSFSILGQDDWSTNRLEQMSKNTKIVADSTAQVMNGKLNLGSQGSLFMLCNNIRMISQAINADIYVCNLSGEIVLCPDLINDDYSIIENGSCAVHSIYRIPQSVIEKAVEGFSSKRSTLDGVYSKEQLVSAQPVVVDGEVIMIVFAATPVSSRTTEYLQRTMKMFLIAAAVSFLIGAIGVYILTINLFSPLKDMSNATKAYAKGDFSYRVRVRGGGELENLLRAFNSMASELALHESTRRSFVANVSHELKTPMTTIGGFIDGILDGTIPPEKQDYYLRIVSEETKRLSRLVVSMLNLSKIEAGELELKPSDFNICNDIFNVMISFEQKIEQKNIEILGLDALEPTVVNADEDMIHQVIYNLVDNAVKFTENAQIIVGVNRNADNSVSVRIRNTGVGIPSEELSRIFERFYKVDKSRSFDTKSTGLGLYIVKTIVEMHGGKITAESAENEYTQFEFTLPQTVQKNNKKVEKA